MQLTSSTFLAALVGLAASYAAPAAAARHHTARHAHHAATSRPRRETAKPPAAPRGITAVPAGGLKVYCARRNPLLVRKMTQGAGTTVTVICR